MFKKTKYGLAAAAVTLSGLFVNVAAADTDSYAEIIDLTQIAGVKKTLKTLTEAMPEDFDPTAARFVTLDPATYNDGGGLSDLYCYDFDGNGKIDGVERNSELRPQVPIGSAHAQFELDNGLEGNASLKDVVKDTPEITTTNQAAYFVLNNYTYGDAKVSSVILKTENLEPIAMYFVHEGDILALEVGPRGMGPCYAQDTPLTQASNNGFASRTKKLMQPIQQ